MRHYQCHYHNRYRFHSVISIVVFFFIDVVIIIIFVFFFFTLLVLAFIMKLNYFDAQCSISWKKFLLRKNSEVAVLLMLWQVFLLSFFVSCILSLLSDFFFSCNWRKRSISFNWLVFTLVTNKSLISVIWLKTKFQRSPQSHTKWNHNWSWMISNHRMKIREWKWAVQNFLFFFTSSSFSSVN